MSYPQGYVYFIESAGLIKIGCSCSPNGRMSQIQAMSASPLKFIGVVRGGVIEEHRWHERFEYLRAHGEWFKKDDRLMSSIMIACDSEKPPIPYYEPPLPLGTRRKWKVVYADGREDMP